MKPLKVGAAEEASVAVRSETTTAARTRTRAIFQIRFKIILLILYLFPNPEHGQRVRGTYFPEPDLVMQSEGDGPSITCGIFSIVSGRGRRRMRACKRLLKRHERL